MLQAKTHREVRNPQISARYLADYMAASERSRRSILRACKYRSTARVVQHTEARLAVSKFIRDGFPPSQVLFAEAERLRSRLADTSFDRDLYDHNADYIERFAKVYGALDLPEADLLAPGKSVAIELGGVKVTPDIHFRLQRVTRNNKLRGGAASLRYAKGKPLDEEVGKWQAAFLFGYLADMGIENDASPEQRLCLVVDAYKGTCYEAPTDSIARYRNMEAACANIADQWPNTPPPPNAVL